MNGNIVGKTGVAALATAMAVNTQISELNLNEAEVAADTYYTESAPGYVKPSVTEMVRSRFIFRFIAFCLLNTSA